MVLAFVVGGYLYKNQRADKIASLALTSGPPLVRDYSQSTGPVDARVVIVEFFDPGCETCRAFAPLVHGLLASSNQWSCGFADSQRTLFFENFRNNNMLGVSADIRGSATTQCIQ